MKENIKAIMKGLGENEFLLPVGYKDGEGTIHRTVKLTPMTGETEEEISDPKVRDNGGKIITTLLASVISELGTLPRVTKEVVRDLTTVDRDFLLIRNRQVSLGDEVSYVENCPQCGGKNEIITDLSRTEVKYLDDGESIEQTFEIPNGVLDSKGVIHKDISITLPTGRIQERVAQVIRANPASATTIMLQLITLKLGDMDYISPEVFRKMTKKDRNFISNKMAEMEIGVKFNTDVYCVECGSEFTTSIPLQSLMGE